jgi:hypothetical protein
MNLEAEAMRNQRSLEQSFRAIIVITLCAFSGGVATTATAESVGRCRFDRDALTFQGGPQEQAGCLLRTVAKFGRVDPQPAVLPVLLTEFIGSPVGALRAHLASFLTAKNLNPAQLGGSLDCDLSHASNGGPTARYFVIHDTSSPWLGNASDFPPNDAQQLNRLSDFAGANAVAHVFVNRLGDTLTGHDFQVPWRATKLETRVIGIPAKGLFLHVELLQPRRRDPTGGPNNDAIAPTPGFTAQQYDKLALLYAMASARAGSWLILAYHAALDESLADGHDDPQNFDLAAFVAALTTLRAALTTQTDALPQSLSQGVGGATAIMTPTQSSERASVCAQLRTAAPALSGGSPLLAAQTGKTYKQLYDECDRNDMFANKSLPIHNGRLLRCSTDRNHVNHVTKYPDGTIMFTAKMSVDADGSPVIGGSGWPNNVQTWLTFDNGSTTHFVNAEEVPFVVVPIAVPGTNISFQRDAGIGRGDLAVAFTDGKCSFGVVGDAGPWFRLGEASLRTHEELGNPQCATPGEHPCRRLRRGSGVGIGSNVTYIIFPGSRPRPLQSQTVNAVAAEQGLTKIKAFLKSQGR